MKKKFRTVLLAALLCFGVLSTGVLATGGDSVSCSDLAKLTQGLTTNYKPNSGDVIAREFYLTQNISADENSEISIHDYRSLDLKEYSLTGNATITVPNGSNFYIQGNGTVEWTIVVESGGTLRLSGGTFNTITVKDGGTLAWNSYYENGVYINYVFRTGTSEEDYAYSRTFSTGATVVPCPHKSYADGKCEVCEAKCTHKTVGNDGKCTTCQYQYAACGLKYNGPDPDTVYYTSATAAMKSSCNTVKLLADCDETVDYNFQGTVDLNGHTLEALSINEQTASEYSLTIEDNSEAKTGTITTLTVNSKTTLKGGKFETITTGENGGNIPLPVGYAFQHTGDNDSGTDFVKRSKIGNSLSDVRVVKLVDHTTHEYANGMCELCGEECQHETVGDGGVCSTCKQQFAGKVTIDNGTTKWFATFSDAWQEIMKQKNSPVPVQFELYQDIKESGTLAVPELELILCLNGHTLERENFEVTNGKLSLTSGDGKSGTLTGPVTSGTGGQFSTSGDVTINGDVTLGGSNDSLGVGTTISGKVTSTSGKTIQAHLSGTHPVLFTKDTDGNYTLFVSGNATEITGVVRVVQCTHDEVTDGKCDYCGGTLVAQIGSTNYTRFATAYNAAKDGETIKLFSNVSDAMTINDSSKKIILDLNGKTVSSLTVSVPATITDSTGGGTITTLNTTGDVKIGGLLAAGYGFRTSGETATWYDGNSEATSVSGVSVQKLPIKSVSISANGNKTSFAYGEDVTLTANVTLASGVTATYAWVNADGSEQSLGSTREITRNDLAPNEYNIRCTVTVDGYSLSNYIEFTVTKATLTTNDYTAPTAKNGLSYNGSDQELINVGGFTGISGPQFWYGLKNADNSISWTTSAVTGRNAGTYTVYWYIDGGTNYENVGSAENPAGTFTVTIAPRTVEPTVTVASGSTYDGTEKKPSVTVKLDGATLTENTDYTVAYENNVNAGTDTAKAIVTAKQGSNYTWTPAVEKTFSIAKGDYNGTTTATGSAKYGASGTVDLSNLIMPGGTAAASVKTDGSSVLDTYSIKNDTSLKFTFKDDAGLVGKTAEIEVSVSGCTNYENYKITVTLTVDDKLTPTVTAPTAIENLAYNGTMQTLITAGSTTGGTLQYSLNNSTWSAALPKAKDADTYTVYYKVIGNADYADTAVNSISVTIGKKAITVKPQSYTITKGNAIPAFALEYDGLVSGDSPTTSAAPTFICYEADGNTAVSTATAAGNYTITWTNSDDFDFTSETNYTVTKATTGTLTINNKPSSGGGGSSSNTTSSTVKNPDGSTTTTVTDKKTGTVTETTTTPNGTSSTTVTDKNGNSTTTVSVSKKDAQSGEAITLPVDEVKAAESSENAQEITVEVPSGGATVEIPVKNPTPGTVIVIVDKEGNETVVPTSKVTENGIEVTLTENATIKVIDNSKDFSDVKDSDYFGNAVQWASARNITGGTSATTFGPHDSCTRAQLVTFLWRAAGCPTAEHEMDFSDVGNGYYTEAVRWAASLGIVGGYGNGQFGSEDTITREQMAVILYRFAQHTGMDTTQGGMAVREYRDYESISDYALSAMQWAVNAGILQGYNNNLMPGQPCTRAQIVTMLYRLLGE